MTKLLKKKTVNVMYAFRSAFPLSDMAVYIFETTCESLNITKLLFSALCWSDFDGYVHYYMLALAD